MFKKILKCFFISCVFALSACSPSNISGPSSGDTTSESEIESISEITSESSSDSSVAEKYTVSWNNYDGSVLEIDTDVLKGTNPSYDGASPTKEASISQVYDFDGWSPSLAPVFSDITYTAQFKSELRKYTVSWYNYDNSLLSTDLYD